jgi:rhodanese-related sulfurtransferase
MQRASGHLGHNREVLVVHAADVETIERKEIRWRLDRAEPFILIETLPEDAYRRGHLPGALCVPPDRVVELVPEMVADRTAEIVVYGGDHDSLAAPQAARELAALGYTNVRVYRGGKRDWMDSGGPVEG